MKNFLLSQKVTENLHEIADKKVILPANVKEDTLKKYSSRILSHYNY